MPKEIGPSRRTDPSGAPRQEKDKYEAFLEMARSHALKMTPGKEETLEEATQKLVGKVLAREFGDSIEQSPKFPQMQKAITEQIMKNPKYRQSLEGLFKILEKF